MCRHFEKFASCNIFYIRDSNVLFAPFGTLPNKTTALTPEFYIANCNACHFGVLRLNLKFQPP